MKDYYFNCIYIYIYIYYSPRSFNQHQTQTVVCLVDGGKTKRRKRLDRESCAFDLCAQINDGFRHRGELGRPSSPRQRWCPLQRCPSG